MGPDWRVSADRLPWCGVESLIADAYGWTPHVIRNLSAEEVLEHIPLIRRRESERMVWQLTVAGQPYRKRRDQQAVLKAAKALAGRERWKAPGDMVDGIERVRLIGNGLVTGGEKWGRQHRRQMKWLQSAGYTPEDAIAEYQRWHAEQASDPFWER